GEPAGPAADPQIALSASPVRDALQPDERRLGGMAEGSMSANFAAPSAAYFDDSLSVTIASNELAIDRQLQSLKNESDRRASAWQAAIGRVLVGGGLVALAILGLLFVLQQQVRWSSGTLALVAAAASLVLGAAWITGNRQEMTVAMSQSRGDSAMAKSEPKLHSTFVAPEAATSFDDRTDSVTAIAPTNDADIKAVPAPSEPAPSETAPSHPAGAASAPAATPAPPPKSSDGRLEAVGPSAASRASAAPTATLAEEGKDQAGNKKFADAERAESAAAGGKNMKPPEKALEKPPEKPLEKLLSRGKGAADEPKSGAGAGAGGFGGGAPRGGLLERPNSAPDLRPDGTAAGQAAPATSAATKPPLPAAPKADDTRRSPNRRVEADKRPLSGAAAPSSIYFNPQLVTDANGIVTLEFELPAVASEYRVLFDAYGNGRVGSSAEVRIVCKPAE
ncbi:MAG: hypothetical protein L0211_13575, partial [Planctomycetaceae bacterium]|nr:hypothetical protein [Planctomycetaceae bacterium]